MVATRKREYARAQTAALIGRAAARQAQPGHDKENLSENSAAPVQALKPLGLGDRTKSLKGQPSNAVRVLKRCRLVRRHEPQQELTGYLGMLPMEILEQVLHQCSPLQLGQLETTCKYFRTGTLIEETAKVKLCAVPRAKDLKPAQFCCERWLTLLLYVTYQSTAAAQGTAVAFGAYHSAALLLPAKDHHVTNRITHSTYTFGRGFHGQLGAGHYDQLTSPNCVSLGYKTCLDNDEFEEEVMPAVVACGSSHTASISRRGELFTWGLASSGELGQNGWMPIEVNVPKQSFPVCNVRIVSVATGGNHTLAISEYGGLFTCGRGRHGQLGHGTFHDEGSLLPVTALSKQYRIVSAAAGKAHSLALAADGTLFTWGHGKSGQLGLAQLRTLAPIMGQNSIVIPTPQKVPELEPERLEPGKRITAIAAAGNHSMALTVNGKVMAFGSNSYGQLGLGDKEDRWQPVEVQLKGKEERRICVRAVQVVCGKNHTLALVSRGGCMEACSTGHNAWGQLGHGDLKDRLVFTKITAIKSIAALQSGDEHCAAVTRDGDLYCWGRGDCGQLGLGDEHSQWKPTKLEGYKVVHPDRTLRRHKRCTPNIRPKVREEPKQPRPCSKFFKPVPQG